MAGFDLTFAEDEPIPANDGPDLKFEDDPADEDARELLWSGKPTTVGAVKKHAAEQGVSPETIMELGTPLGKLESKLAKTAGGQAFLRTADMVEQLGDTALSLTARAVGRDDISTRLRDYRKQRQEFLTFAEKGGDVQEVIGDRGSRIYNGVIDSVGKTAALGTAIGPAAVYSYVAGDAWDSALYDAQQAGLSGNEQVGYAATTGAIEGLVTLFMGKAFGNSLEESFSPAFRSTARNLIRGPETKSLITRAVKELGGITAEGAEELLINGAQQNNEFSTGLREEMDLGGLLESGLSGVVGRGSVGAVKKLKTHLQGLQKKLPDIANATRDAGIDIERGVNPFLLKDADDKELDRQLGRPTASKQYRLSYRDALNHYIDEARGRGETGALDRLEKDALKLHEEERQQEQRRKDLKAKAKTNKGKAGESVVTVEPVVEQPIQTANERAEFSYNDFLGRITPHDPAIVEPSRNINPYVLAPWESETRQERSLRSRNRRIAEYKDQIKGLRETTAQNKRLREDQLKSAQELIQENIPKDEQYKFINRIRTAKSPKQVDRLLGAVEKHIDAREHRTAKQMLVKAFGKASGLRQEFADIVGGLRSSFDLAGFNGREAAQKLRELATENPNIILSEKESENLDRLEKTNVEDMKAPEIRELAEYVQDLAYQSGIKDRIIGNMESASLGDTADTIAQEAAAAPKREMHSDATYTNRIRKALGRNIDDVTQGETRTRASLLGGEWTERPEATLHAHPTLRKIVYDDVMDATDNYNLQMKAVTDELGGLLDQLGLAQTANPQASVRKVMTGNSGTAHDAWRDQKRRVGNVEITRGEADAILWQLRDPENFRDMQGEKVYLEEGKRLLPPMTPKLIAELTDFSGDKSQALLDFAFGYGNGPLIDAVNDTNEVLTGRKLTDKKQAVPRSVKSDDEYTQLVSRGRNGMQNALVDSYGNLKHREGGKYQFKIPAGMDFLDMFMAHVSRMQRFATNGVAARNAEAVLNDPTVKQAYVAKNGQQGFEQIAEAVKMQVVGSPSLSPRAKAIQTFNSHVAGAHVASKFSVLASQTLDPVTAAAYTPGGFKHLGQAYAEMMDRDIGEIRAEMDAGLSQYSGEYWHRYKSDEVASTQSHGQIRRQGYFRVPSVAQLGMQPVSQAELHLASIPNYLAAKAAAREQFGIQDSAAHWENPEWAKFVAKEWNRKTLRGSTSSHPLELSGALRFVRQNPLAGLVLTFMNTSKNIYSLASMAETEQRSGRYGRAGSMLAGLGVTSILYAALQEALSFEEKEPFLAGTAKRIVSNFAGLFPIAGSLIDTAILRPLMGQKGFQQDSGILLQDVIVGAASDATNVILAMTEEGGKEVDQQAFLGLLGDLAASSAALLGLPGPAVKDYVKRLKGGLLPGLTPVKSKEKSKKFSLKSVNL